MPKPSDWCGRRLRRGPRSFLTQDLQFNRVLQNRALEQAGRFVAEDLASRFLLFLDTGELDKMLKRPVKAEAVPGGNAPPEAAR